MLFAENGDFIYVGKASDLHQTLTGHFGPNEENERIKGFAKWAIWEQTHNIDGAEDAEGHLYDTWVHITGLHPFANKIKPPKSKLSDNKITAAKLRQILAELRARRLR